MQYWARRLEQEIDGVMRIFGGVQQLRKKHSAGHSVGLENRRSDNGILNEGCKTIRVPLHNALDTVSEKPVCFQIAVTWTGHSAKQ
ncbi:hypothetical protein TURU_016300 [Turdus rufiventris]|nr:hypothetical protein TURU_016300 [Turdus rufiventris]